MHKLQKMLSCRENEMRRRGRKRRAVSDKDSAISIEYAAFSQTQRQSLPNLAMIPKTGGAMMFVPVPQRR